MGNRGRFLTRVFKTRVRNKEQIKIIPELLDIVRKPGKHHSLLSDLTRSYRKQTAAFENVTID